jgi:DNA-binding response OmpR family regulator
LMAVPTGKTVVVTDDTADLRAVTAAMIAQRGHKVLEADGGHQTLDYCKSQKVDLLVLDLMMPEMSGIETIEKLREGGFPTLPVIMLTALDSDDDLVAAYAAGADYYLTKPFRAAQLMNIVDFLIGDLSAEQRAELEAKL